MTGLLQLTSAHAKEFFRVRQEVFLAFALPVIFMVILGAVISNIPDIGNVTNEALGLEIGVVIAAEDARTREVVDAIESVGTLRTVRTTGTEGLARLDTGELAALVLVPPPDARGEIVVRYNRTRTQRSRVVLNRLYPMIAELNARALDRTLPLSLEVEAIGGEDDYSSYVDFFVPGVVAMAVFPGVVFSLTPTIVNQRQRGLLRRLWLTPASLGSYVASHALFRLGLAVAQAALILVAAAVVFHRPFHYGLLRLLLLCGVGSLTGSAVALLLATVARSHAAGVTLAQLTMIPMLLACGAFFPLELMPAAVMPVIDALPLTPLAAGIRGVLNFDHALSTLWSGLGLMGLYIVIAGGLGLRFFRWDPD